VPIPKESFESVEEWHSGAERKYVIGILPFRELKYKTWWKENHTSLILMPDPVVESLELAKLKKISLELAGIS
jgi:homoserine dehydrogenase